MCSGGRLELEIGTRWLNIDYQAVGVPYERPGVRVERIAGAIPLIKRLLRPQAVTHAVCRVPCAHYSVRDLDVMPKTLQQPHPPLFVGGAGRRMLTLAAREATASQHRWSVHRTQLLHTDGINITSGSLSWCVFRFRITTGR